LITDIELPVRSSGCAVRVAVMTIGSSAPPCAALPLSDAPGLAF
jgi:hypothetical protein